MTLAGQDLRKIGQKLQRTHRDKARWTCLVCPRCGHLVGQHGIRGCVLVDGGECCPCPGVNVPRESFDPHYEISDAEVWGMNSDSAIADVAKERNVNPDMGGRSLVPLTWRELQLLMLGIEGFCNSECSESEPYECAKHAPLLLRLDAAAERLEKAAKKKSG